MHTEPKNDKMRMKNGARNISHVIRWIILTKPKLAIVYKAAERRTKIVQVLQCVNSEASLSLIREKLEFRWRPDAFSC